MFKSMLATAALLLCGTATASTESPSPQLMVLGAVHFGNPGRDQVNMEFDDVLSPGRQDELDRLVEALAQFRPTHVAVEWERARQPELDRAYAAWRAGNRSDRSELDQIAFRLAERLGLEQVDAVDWQRPPPGEEASYDFVTWAQAQGRRAEFDAALAPVQADSAALQQAMPCLTVAQWLARANDPNVQLRNARTYYPIARLGDADAAPGAVWVGGSWHARNLKIWANLADRARAPEDRILLLIGAGHRPFVERFAKESGTFTLVDPLVWLPRDRRVAREDGTSC